MFEPTSRYAKLETATLDRPDGRTVAYVRRRFLPRGATSVSYTHLTLPTTERV